MNNKIILVTVFILLFVLSSCDKTYTDIDEYNQYLDDIQGSDLFMPQLNTLGNCVSTEVLYYDSLGESVSLICYYQEEDFEVYLDAINNDYRFLENPIVDEQGEVDIPSVDFEYGNFRFRVVQDEYFEYPEEFGMIGISDDEHAVAYVFFHDESLSFITSMDDFMETEIRFPTS